MGSIGIAPQQLIGARLPNGLVNQWHSQPRKLKIIHVGAGATGLCTAFKMERQLTDYELICYEKNDEIGGTWYENRYPGCACDVPAPIYTYTFEANPEWKSYYAYSPEIQNYFTQFADKYNLRKYVKLHHKVVSATWVEQKGQYEVGIETPDGPIVDHCDILMNGSGLINKWRWPTIEGLHSYQGPLMHSAAWNHDVHCTDKRVAVLGTGSSAIQIVPQIQKVAKKLTTFIRSPTWISPPMPRIEIELNKPDDSAELKDNYNPDEQQYWYKPEEIQKLRDDPDLLLNYRKRIEYAINTGFSMFYADTEASRMAEKYMRNEMGRRLGYHPKLSERLIPKWAPGCRRLTPGDGYLEALVKDNVEPVYEEIDRIAPNGIHTADGQFYEVDVIVCATGFDMAWTPHFKLLGRNGLDIKDSWKPVPNCYLGVAAPGFPNYFVMNGPRSNLCNGTVLPCLETEIEYVIKAAKKMQSDRIKALDVSEDVTYKLNEHLEKWHSTSVWRDQCKSWYKNNTVDGKVMCWGGSSLHFLKCIKYPRWEHWNFTYMDDDIWGFLGNGKTEGETKGDFDLMTPYLRKSDVDWDIR